MYSAGTCLCMQNSSLNFSIDVKSVSFEQFLKYGCDLSFLNILIINTHYRIYSGTIYEIKLLL